MDGFEGLNKFALGVLALTNAKSSRKGTVVDFRTFEGTNIVSVTSLVEIDGTLTSLVGEIRDKEPIDIIQIEFDDLKTKGQKVISDMDGNEEDCFLFVYVKSITPNF